MDTLLSFGTSLMTLFPPLTQDTLLFYGIILCIYIFVFKSIKTATVLWYNRQVAKVSKPYSRVLGQGGKKILILGDSTAVGAGADRIQDTIAGRLAFDFPSSDIINLGTNGSLIRDVLSQLEPVRDQKFDMVIISTGGNDVISFTSLYKIQQDLEQIFQTTKNMCEQKVFFLLYVNFSTAPFFPALIRVVLNRRANLLYEIMRGVGARERVPIIELFADPHDDPMRDNPGFYFAKDGIHPNNEGYRLWYNRMWRVMTSRGFYYSRHDANLTRSETFAQPSSEPISR